MDFLLDLVFSLLSGVLTNVWSGFLLVPVDILTSLLLSLLGLS